MKTDILIVGSGCAGLYAALNLPGDKQITIITKDIVEHSDSFLAQGGMCMLKSEDDYDSYFEDTMKAGHYENDPKSVEVMIRSSVDIVNDLVKYGADFHREPDGSLSYTKEGAHSHHRIISMRCNRKRDHEYPAPQCREASECNNLRACNHGGYPV